ncbi:MAG: MBL fold metallo-hydrolase [Nitrospinota bacterium]
MQEVADGVFAEIEYTGCNVSCVKTDDGVLLVDTPQNPSDALHWRKEVEKIGPIRYQVNTEHHPDHIMGNWFFRDARFIAHEGTHERFRERVSSVEEWKKRIEKLDPKGMAHMEGFDFREPDILFNERMTLYLGDREIRLIHKVGHTENQAMVYVPDAKALMPGDNVVENWAPFLHSGVPHDWLETLDFIDGMDVDVIVPGHGVVCGKSVVKTLSNDIRELVASVQEAIDEGKTKEQAQEMKDYVLKWEPVRKKDPNYYPILGGLGIGRIYDILKPPPEDEDPKKKKKKG